MRLRRRLIDKILRFHLYFGGFDRFFHTVLRESPVKKKIHPKYEMATFTCSCGTKIEVGATIGSTHIEICDKCHPFYTGKQKLIDSAGRVERFRRRYEKVKKDS